MSVVAQQRLLHFGSCQELYNTLKQNCASESLWPHL